MFQTIAKEKTRSDNGTFSGWEYIVDDQVHRPTEKPTSDKTDFGKSATTKNTYSTKETSLQKEMSFYENDALEKKKKKTPGLDDYYSAWNNYCGSLPKVRNNREAEKLIKRELKNRTSFELVEAIQMGARVVSADPFWQKNKYGLVNLLRHLDSKVEVNESNGGFVGADATAFSLASGIWDAVK